MPRYLFAVHHDDGVETMSPERQEQAWRETGEFNQRMKDMGSFVFAGGLHDADRATVVDDRDGRSESSPGCYITRPPRLSGFWILDAPDDETALAWAHDASRACNEPVEVRPFH